MAKSSKLEWTEDVPSTGNSPGRRRRFSIVIPVVWFNFFSPSNYLPTIASSKAPSCFLSSVFHPTSIGMDVLSLTENEAAGGHFVELEWTLTSKTASKNAAIKTFQLKLARGLRDLFRVQRRRGSSSYERESLRVYHNCDCSRCTRSDFCTNAWDDLRGHWSGHAIRTDLMWNRHHYELKPKTGVWMQKLIIPMKSV